ncbi:MAG: DNA-processing protein DprA [Acidimicrobiales bacterium]
MTVDTPPEAFAAALAGLPGMGPARLAALLTAWPPAEAWSRVLAGTARRVLDPQAGPVAKAWRRAAAAVDMAALWKAQAAKGVTTAAWGCPGYPAVLHDDPEPPAVLFSRGNLASLDGRRVAIVGARRCTRYGRDVAYELGHDLAASGVRVVSGLALGIDGAAHRGALAASAAPPVAVVGSGLDVFYPRSHERLWAEVAEAGVVLSEAPLGAPPEPWRFPVRNRIIAGLAEVVVVVESFHTGGSRHTVEAAATRSRPVLAVPGPVRSPASDLPNALLAEGCHPARDALDVLVALNLEPDALSRGPGADPRPPPSPSEAAVLDVLGWEPASFEQVVLSTGGSPAEVGLALAHLERDGWVAGRAGWWERVADAGGRRSV